MVFFSVLVKIFRMSPVIYVNDNIIKLQSNTNYLKHISNVGWFLFSLCLVNEYDVANFILSPLNPVNIVP